MHMTCQLYQTFINEEGEARQALAQFLKDIVSLMKQAKDPKVQKTSVHEGIVKLWESVREMSSTHNVIFETSDGEVSAHDHILMAASPVLKAMLQSAMKEGKDQRVQVRDSTKCGMTLFVDVLYTSSTCLELDYKTILEAFDLAHRWQVQYVADILAETLKGEIRVASFAEIAEAAVLKAVEPLKRACVEFGAKDQEIQTMLNENGLPPAVTNWIQQVFELLDFKSKLTSVSFMVQCKAEQLFPNDDVVKLAAPGLYFVLSPILAMLGIFLISSVVVYVFVPLARRRGVEFTEAAKKQKQREEVMEVLEESLESPLQAMGLTFADVKASGVLADAPLPWLLTGVEEPKDFAEGLLERSGFLKVKKGLLEDCMAEALALSNGLERCGRLAEESTEESNAPTNELTLGGSLGDECQRKSRPPRDFCCAAAF
eukprot:s201_g6.t1